VSVGPVWSTNFSIFRTRSSRAACQRKPSPKFVFDQAFSLLAGKVQGKLHRAARRVIAELNGALNTVANEFPTVKHVTPNFAGHDLCAGGQAWVFGPPFQADVRVLGVTLRKGVGGVPLCPDPVSSGEKFLKFARKFPGREIALGAGTNRVPHPTEEGQERIAQAVLRTLKRPLHSVPTARRATHRQRR